MGRHNAGPDAKLGDWTASPSSDGPTTVKKNATTRHHPRHLRRPLIAQRTHSLTLLTSLCPEESLGCKGLQLRKGPSRLGDSFEFGPLRPMLSRHTEKTDVLISPLPRYLWSLAVSRIGKCCLCCCRGCHCSSYCRRQQSGQEVGCTE